MMESVPPSPMQNRRSQPRVSQACQMCKIKKAKCAQTVPCKNCETHGWNCVYDKKNPSRGSPYPRRRSNAQKREPVRAQVSSTSLEVSSQEQHGQRVSDSPGFSNNDSGEQVVSEEHQDATSVENQQEIEPLRDVNEHTTGREYYGRSSNFALLGQLFTHARSNRPAGGHTMAISVQSTLDTPDAATTSSTGTSGRDLQHRSKSNPTNSKSSLGTDRLSIVNLLYDDETSVAEPNFTAPLLWGEGYLDSDRLIRHPNALETKIWI
ncbi:hypothetical protein DL95DRAFT_190039 [Leptodontidium sp. 2 PMI_412]|nr:hypothetical protein DL95DRAFT_190039 [Leptodontidium sp. 2 PMI_412]